MAVFMTLMILILHQKPTRIMLWNIYLKITNTTIKFTMMKKTFYLLLFLFSFTLSAQEARIAQEDVQKILKHLQMNYRIPSEVYNDSIIKINYNVHFVINEEGRIIEPKIISKNAECGACERELFRVLKRTPAV